MTHSGQSSSPLRVALIGDVHGNLPALQAVLRDIERRGVDEIWNIGDWVGYGANPSEVVQHLRALPSATHIVGNYDRKVLRFPRKRKRWKKRKQRVKFLAFQAAYRGLTENDRDYLSSLPYQRSLERGPWSIQMVHGSPAAIDDPIGPTMATSRLVALTRLAPVSLVVCGHTHRAWHTRVKGTLFVNSGSVGRVEDGDPRTRWTLLILHHDLKSQIDHFRIPYDVDRAIRGVKDEGLPAVFGDMLREGLPLSAFSTLS